MPQVTVFPNTFESGTPYYAELDQIYRRIVSERYRPIIDKIRKIEDKAERDNQKKLLPAILFAGRFTARKNAAFQAHSGYCCLDFDKLGDRFRGVWDTLESMPYTVMLFRSPSGNGIKCIFRIPANTNTHRDSLRAIRHFFASEPSYDHFPDEARICYISHDPTAYFNPSAEVFEQMFEAPKPHQVEVHELVSDHDQIYENLKKWLTANKQEHYADGNKHKFLVKLAGACNRFGISEHTCLGKLKYDYLNAAGQVNEQDFERLVKSVYTLYRSHHATVHFDRKPATGPDGPAIYQRTEGGKYQSVEQMPELPEEVARDVIYVDNIRGQIKDIFRNGFVKASTTYYRTIDDLWKWKPGDLNLMSGIMNHGKSTLMLQLMLIKSVKDGDKWAVFSPEQNPPDEFYLDLAHTYLGKSTFGEYSNKCTEEELDAALDFLQRHFFFIYPADEAPTPEYINARFTEVIIKHGVTGCMIDPYNQLDNDIRKNGNREDLYLSAFLTKQKRFALDNNVYMVIIAHPNGSLQKVKMNGQADNVGNYECPDIYDLSGGAMWGNKCDNILFTYRPYYSSDPTNTTTIFKSAKIKKQKITGVPGSTTLNFDRKVNRYFEEGQYCPLTPPKFNNESPFVQVYNPYNFLKKPDGDLDWNNPKGPF